MRPHYTIIWATVKCPSISFSLMLFGLGLALGVAIGVALNSKQSKDENDDAE